MTLRRRPAAALLACALFASGCVSAAADEVLPARPAADQASTGGSLMLGITPPGAIHPSLASSPDGQLISSLVCDTLVHLDPETGEVLPGLAEAFVVSGDGAAITFRLRKGVPMHDGSELTAHDVVTSLHRLASPEEGSYLADLLAGVVGFRFFSGRDLEEGEERPSRMGGVETLERHSFQVRLERADPQFVRRFANPALAPVSAAAMEANPLAVARQPVCAGPYELARPFRPGDTELQLVRDEDFPGGSPALTNGGSGYLDTIRFRIYPDAAAALAGYDAGEVDAVRVPTERFGAAAEAHPSDVLEGPHPTVEYIGLPIGGLPTALGIDVGPTERFDEIAARQALSLALDRSRIAAAMHDGGRLPATSFTPPSAGSYAHRDPLEDAVLDALPTTSLDAAVAVEDGTPYCQALLDEDGDVQRARSLLDGSTLVGADGPRPVGLRGRTVPFYFNAEFGNAAFVEQVAREWERTLGLRLRPVALSWEEFLDRGTSGAGFGDGFFRFSWRDAGLDPQAYLRALVDERPENLGRFLDDTVSRLLAELGTVGGEDHRLEFHELEDVLCALLPMIPVTFARSRWLVRDDAIGRARDQAIGWDGQLLVRELFRES